MSIPSITSAVVLSKSITDNKYNVSDHKGFPPYAYRGEGVSLSSNTFLLEEELFGES
jgi:hypothetical protein